MDMIPSFSSVSASSGTVAGYCVFDGVYIQMTAEAKARRPPSV